MAGAIDPAASSTFSEKLDYALSMMEGITRCLADQEARLVALKMAATGSSSSAITEVPMAAAPPSMEAVPPDLERHAATTASASAATVRLQAAVRGFLERKRLCSRIVDRPGRGGITSTVLIRDTMLAGGISGKNEMPATAVKATSGGDIGACWALAVPLLDPYSQHQFTFTFDAVLLDGVLLGAAARCADLGLQFGCLTSRRANFLPGCDRPSGLLLCGLLDCCCFLWVEARHILLFTWDPGKLLDFCCSHGERKEDGMIT